MLPTGIDIVVVEVVVATHVHLVVMRVVVVNRSALVFGIDILHYDVPYPPVVLEVELHSEEPVGEVVEYELTFLLHIPLLARSVTVVVNQEHGRMVFEILVGIERELPGIGIVVQSCYPAAEVVSFRILIYGRHLRSISSAWYQSLEHALQASVVLHDSLFASSIKHVACSTELCRHFQSKLKREWHEAVRIAYHYVARLAVVEHAIGIFALPVCE